MRRLILLLLLLVTTLPVDAAPLVVFVHGRYQEASSSDWADDDPALDASVHPIVIQAPLGDEKFCAVTLHGVEKKYLRDSYWRSRPNSLASAVESLVGRENVLYVHYDSRNSYFYEPSSGPLLATQVRQWLRARHPQSRGQDLVFIAHSHGGIVVRWLLSHPESFGDIVKRTREVITLASPQAGSELADASLDGMRAQNLTDSIASLDSTITGLAGMLSMKITLWSMLSPRLQEALVPVSERAEREAAAQGLKGAAYQQQVRRARARWLAQGLEAQFSGRIDASLSTKSMDGYGALDAKDMRALRTELGIPFHWLRGAEFPVAFANIPQFMAQTRFWNDSDWVYFFTSSMVLDVRLKQRFPTQAELRRNDGAVSAASASAVGAPLTGNAATSTLPTNHDGLLFHPGVIKAVLDALRE